MSKLARCFGYVTLPLLLVSIALAQPLPDRRTNEKNCAEMLARLGRAKQIKPVEDQLREWGVKPEELRPGTIFLMQDGRMLVWPHSAETIAELKLVTADRANADTMSSILKEWMQSESPVFVSGQGPLDAILQRADELKIGAERPYLVSPYGVGHQWADAKERLLKGQFTQVEIVVDLPGDDLKTRQLLQEILLDAGQTAAAITDKKLNTPHVRVLRPNDLGDHGTLAERLEASPPAEGVLRITLVHQSGREYRFTDGTKLEIGKLARRRLEQGRFDVLCGCNLPPDAAGWIVFDGLVFLQELRDTVQKIEQVVGGSGGPPPPNGGPPGDEPPPGASGKKILDALVESLDRKDRRVFKLFGWGLAALIADLLAGDGAHAATSPSTTQSTTSPTTGPAVGAGSGGVFFATGYFDGTDVATVTASVIDRNEKSSLPDATIPTLAANAHFRSMIELRDDGTLAFIPATGVDHNVPMATLVVSHADRRLNDDERKAVLTARTKFWFVQRPGKLTETQQTLQQWQKINEFNIPFIFIDVSKEEPEVLAEALRPFFATTTHVGQAIPHGSDEAYARGLFWCPLHDSQHLLDQYEHVGEIMRNGVVATPIYLADHPVAQLKLLWQDPQAVAWLTGVWRESELMLSGQNLGHQDWAGEASCQARIVFVSLAPPDAMSPRRFFETKRFSILEPILLSLRDAARKDDHRAMVEPSKALLTFLKGNGGCYISSCGKFMLIHE